MADALTADVHEEILHLLPSNDLLNFRRVSKDWNDLISSHRFAQRHLLRSNRTLIVTLRPSGITVHDDRKIRTAPIPYPHGFSADNARIAGSCDGLVCMLRTNSDEFAAINPSTAKSAVRTANGAVFKRHSPYWFGRHPRTGEYLIVEIDRLEEGITTDYLTGGEVLFQTIRVREFTSALLSSQEFEIAASHRFDTKPIMFGGALLWVGFAGGDEPHRRRVVVLAYDIEKKKLLENSTPFEFDDAALYVSLGNVRLGILDGCLAMFQCVYGRWGWEFELWVTEEHGVEESWTKYANIEWFERCRNLYPLGFLSDGDLVLDLNNGKIVKYSFDDERGTIVQDDADIGTIVRNDADVAANSTVLCVDSLVSPAIVTCKIC